MFRLIKLAMYAMIGYVLYELYQGMTQQQGAAQLKVDQSTVSRHLRAFEEQTAELKEEVDLFRTR